MCFAHLGSQPGFWLFWERLVLTRRVLWGGVSVSAVPCRGGICEDVKMLSYRYDTSTLLGGGGDLNVGCGGCTGGERSQAAFGACGTVREMGPRIVLINQILYVVYLAAFCFLPTDRETLRASRKYSSYGDQDGLNWRTPFPSMPKERETPVTSILRQGRSLQKLDP